MIGSKKPLDWNKKEGKGFLRKGYLLHMLGFLYVTLALIVIHFDLGKNDFSKMFVGTMATIAPSIITTSSLTLRPDSAAVILSISWLLVVFVTITMIMFANWKEINYERYYKNTSSLLIFSTFICIPILVVFMLSYTPHDSGILGRTIYFNLKNSIYFVILYGAALWLSLSAGLFFIAFNSYFLFKKRINHE